MSVSPLPASPGSPGPSSEAPGPPGAPVPSAAPPAVPVDRHRWPDVARVPRISRFRRAVAGKIIRYALGRLPLHVRFGAAGSSGERRFGLGGPLMEVHDPRAFVSRIGAHGLIGFGESYMAGEWEADDLVGVLTAMADDAAHLVPPRLQRLRPAWAPRKPAAQRNTLQGSRDNISHHYDLSNELFALFLDETMSYSAALFRGFPADRSLLAAAQHRKIDRLLEEVGAGPGIRLLEIGTGWGELAIRAAERGARVTTVTLSGEQRALARERVRAAGMEDRVTVLLCDYREVRGTFDALVSVEMIEAVGAEFWPDYFMTTDRLLAPGGRSALQAITMPHDRMLAGKDTFTWIHKYIFPGGQLPSTEAIERITTECTALRPAGRESFGPHYAETLRLWRERFGEAAGQVDALGFDAVFRRMWTFFLAYSEAGFRSGYLDVQQILFTKEARHRSEDDTGQGGPR